VLAQRRRVERRVRVLGVGQELVRAVRNERLVDKGIDERRAARARRAWN
jgi:hypothetical protein